MLMLWFVDSSRNVPWYFHYAFIDENRRIWRWGNGFLLCPIALWPQVLRDVYFWVSSSDFRGKHVVRQNYCYRTLNARNAKKAHRSRHLHDESITMKFKYLDRCSRIRIWCICQVSKTSLFMFFLKWHNKKL